MLLKVKNASFVCWIWYKKASNNEILAHYHWIMRVKARAIKLAITELRLFFVIRTVPPPITAETNMETNIRW
jgi:hypothetical protein